jgi:predicted oxidoreductase
MGIIDNLKGKAVDWLFSIALKKGAKKLAQVLIAWVASLPLEAYGVSVGFQEAAVVAAIAGALEVARNWLKHKVGVSGL